MREVSCLAQGACQDAVQRQRRLQQPSKLLDPAGPPQDRHDLDRQWAEKLHAADKAACEAQAALRLQLEARLTAVSDRVAGLVKKESKRERQRGEFTGRGIEHRLGKQRTMYAAVLG